MKILVLGATGMLGHKCVQHLRAAGEVVAVMRRTPPMLPEEVYAGAKVLSGIDATDFGALGKLLRSEKPDVVINAVGIIKQRDEAEEKAISMRVNAELPHALAKLCAEVGAYFITFGTDCVFSCAGQGPYTESSPPTPDDLYGRSKLAGEVTNLENALTLRLSIVGRELFAPRRSLLEWFFANQGGKVSGYTHALYSGVTTTELVRVLAMLIQRKERISGLWQVAGPFISKYELLLKTNKIFNLDIEIAPQDDFRCDRRLEGRRFAEKTGYNLPSWDDMLEQMRRENSLYR